MTFRRCFREMLTKNNWVIFVEDVVTTGESVRKTKKAVKTQTEAKILNENPFCIWDRNGGNPQSILQDKANAYDPDECPMCAAGEEIMEVK